MLQFLNRPYPYHDDLRYNLKVVTGITLGIFLFLLFFQPIGAIQSNFDNKLLFYAGYAGIILIILTLLKIVIPSMFPSWFSGSSWKLSWDILLNAIAWGFLCVAFGFYTRFVVQVPITFFLVVKIVLIALAPVVIYIIINEYRRNRKHALLTQRKESGNAGVNVEEIKEKPVEIEFTSGTKSEKLNLPLHQIILIKSANNYIEIFWKTAEGVQRQLIRATLSKTERMLKKYPEIIRCHRMYIINANCVKKLSGGTNTSQLILSDFPEPIPVSRHYLLRVTETLNFLAG
ncbi:MAG: LytTR family transcriptional regulator DNA-binding domain-containing protein [Bacteroidales bacterium]|nr:LytTR family transcriptional regulator DNA-binding domain-containing protein [Bacteroidota bacterium]MBL6949668.1 LytTR family transcriptional regulator DNA-binding domain-containing protein [Bacteroidales bacterium]